MTNRLRENLRNFARRGAAVRLEGYGRPCEYKGVSFLGTKTPTRDARTLRDGGFTVEADTTVRFSKSAVRFVPQAEDMITVDGQDYRIAEVKDIAEPHAEWLLALHNLG